MGFRLVSHWPGQQLSLCGHPAHSQGTGEWLHVGWRWGTDRWTWATPLAPVGHIPSMTGIDRDCGPSWDSFQGQRRGILYVWKRILGCIRTIGIWGGGLESQQDLHFIGTLTSSSGHHLLEMLWIPARRASLRLCPSAKPGFVMFNSISSCHAECGRE